MSAMVPGGPKISYLRCLGLKGRLSLMLLPPYEGRISEPKMPCSRDTVNPPATITSSMTSGIHSRLRTPKIVNPPPGSAPAPCQPLEHATTRRPRHARRRHLECDVKITSRVVRGAQTNLYESNIP